jgi:hypothetical protein
MEKQVRMAKETEQATDTHQLEIADGQTSQNDKRNTTSNGHSPPGECRWMNKSKWKNK